MGLSLIQHLTFLFTLIFVFRSLLKCGPLPAQHLTDSASRSTGSSAVCTSFLSMHLLALWCPPQLQQRRKCMLPTFTNSFYVINFSLKFQSHISNLILIFLFLYLYFFLFLAYPFTNLLNQQTPHTTSSFSFSFFFSSFSQLLS